MKRSLRWLAAMAALGLGQILSAAEPERAAPAADAGRGTVIATPAGGKVTINAKSVLYDFAKRMAQFTEQVTVTDEQVMLTADRMDVYLTEGNAVQRVEAVGNVVIRELGSAKRATAGKGVYDMSEDTVVLTENPYLEDRDQGFSTRGADRILYFRGKQQFKAEGENVQIEFGVKGDGVRAPAAFLRPSGESGEPGSGKGTREEKKAP